MTNEIITFGCRLNTYESEVMRAHAKNAGLENAIIINTCAVTAEAERQARQTIRKIRRENPEAHIIVTGCAVQISPEKFASMPEVNRVLGNHEKMQAQSFLPEVSERVLVNDIMSIQETAQHLISGFEGKSRAFIQVQNGCDHRCTFCTIPYGRGNSRSVPLGLIVDQVRKLVDEGYQEVVLTGVDITSYGPDLPGKPTLGQMMKRLLMQVKDLPRLRLSSLDPVEIDEDLYRLIAEEPRLMPHLHISLQAGHNMILKRMKRRHLREDAIAFTNKVRILRPDVTFGADLIAGFPTETEEMFQDTLKIVDDCDLAYLHVFPYSPRPGTPAARMPQVDKTEIKDRAKRLRDKGAESLARNLARFEDQTISVLMETETQGHSEHFAPVEFQSPQKPGQLVCARVLNAMPTTLIAEAVI